MSYKLFGFAVALRGQAREAHPIAIQVQGVGNAGQV